MHNSTHILLEYNTGRDPERLTRKLDAIAADPFSFFRGTNSLYAASLADATLLHDTPRTLTCDGLYPESSGSFKGDNGLAYFDMNDFDETLAAPLTVDLVRVPSSLQVASFGQKLTDEDAHNLYRRFLDTYAAVLVEGKPYWVERATTTGIVRNLLHALYKRNRAAYFIQYTERVGSHILLRIDDHRTLRTNKDEAHRARRILETYGQQGNGQCFTAVDIARRIAGTGNLGLERYSVLIHPENDPAALRLIDTKLSIPSIWADVLGSAYNVAPQRNEVGRVVDIQHVSQAISPALLRGVIYGAKGEKPKSYVVKNLQPTADRVTPGSDKNVVANLDDALQTMAHVATQCHPRGCGRHGADLVEKAQDYAAGMAWRKSALKLAVHGRKVSLKQWTEFAKDYRQVRGDKAA